VRRLLETSATSGTGTTNAYELCGVFSFEVVCRAGFAKTFDQESLYVCSTAWMPALSRLSLTRWCHF
jgi:hypothetical protein